MERAHVLRGAREVVASAAVGVAAPDGGAPSAALGPRARDQAPANDLAADVDETVRLRVDVDHRRHPCAPLVDVHRLPARPVGLEKIALAPPAGALSVAEGAPRLQHLRALARVAPGTKGPEGISGSLASVRAAVGVVVCAALLVFVPVLDVFAVVAGIIAAEIVAVLQGVPARALFEPSAAKPLELPLARWRVPETTRSRFGRVALALALLAAVLFELSSDADSASSSVIKSAAGVSRRFGSTAQALAPAGGSDRASFTFEILPTGLGRGAILPTTLPRAHPVGAGKSPKAGRVGHPFSDREQGGQGS